MAKVSKEELERQKLQRESNLRELKNEFKNIKTDLDNLTFYINEHIKRGTTNEKHDWNRILKRITQFKKTVQNSKNWFLYWKERDWCDKE